MSLNKKKSKKSKICILFAGGTIGMVKNSKTGVLEPAKNAEEILKKIPGLEDIAEIDFKVIVNIDSSNMTPSIWSEIANKIAEFYDEYDGFVIAQGTDTMAYTASALSFALQDLDKPVILTGSLIPLSSIGADGVNNLIYACLTATLDIAEVCIVFANRIIRGNRAKKHHESFVDVFHSPNYPYLGELGRPPVLYDWRKKRKRRVLKLKSDFEENIALFKLYPGFSPAYLDLAIESKVKGIILEAFGPGNIPFNNNSIIPQIKKAISSEIPVIISTQLEKGITNLYSYEAGYIAAEAGAISSKDMTIEATIAKLMWVLANSSNQKEIKDLMEIEIAGELDDSI